MNLFLLEPRNSDILGERLGISPRFSNYSHQLLRWLWKRAENHTGEQNRRSVRWKFRVNQFVYSKIWKHLTDLFTPFSSVRNAPLILQHGSAYPQSFLSIILLGYPPQTRLVLGPLGALSTNYPTQTHFMQINSNRATNTRWSMRKSRYWLFQNILPLKIRKYFTGLNTASHYVICSRIMLSDQNK